MRPIRSRPSAEAIIPRIPRPAALTSVRGARAPLADARVRILRWIALETAPGRLAPWLPVPFGLGIALYFSAQTEPLLWAPAALAAALLVLCVATRRHARALPVAIALLLVAAGFATATLKRVANAHPVLWHSASRVEVSGFITMHEERERTDRITVAVRKIGGAPLNEPPARVRVSVRKGSAPAVGSHVTFRTRLSSPSAPGRPGGYDFARDLWFQGIGATGYVLGRIETTPALEAPSYDVRYAAMIESVRTLVDRRIRSLAPGDAGSIASALITGKRDAISAPVNDALYVSSLAHVLSISGYHMAVVAGIVFFVIRGLLALIPALAARRPIKKWAAATALAAAALYLVLSGAEVATQRAFIMTAVVLCGVMIDRAALTVRTLALAALVVLALAPQALVHPSFQMSFAATLALVATYEGGLPIPLAKGGSLAARIALWGGREIITLIVASLVAGLATTLYAAFHFHRLAPYGVLANLLGMPIISAVSMPAGLLALLAMPFGFDAPLWRIMGEGINAMTSVAVWVASLPGAAGRVTAFGIGPVLLGTTGLLLLCLLRSPLRFAGMAALAAAVLVAATTRQPDIYVAPSATAVAVRGASGAFSLMQAGPDALRARAWLAADADPRPTGDPSLRDGTACDAASCLATLPDGARIALVLRPEAFEDDCRNAAVIVTRHAPPDACAAMVIGRDTLARTGTLALHRTAQGWRVEPTRDALQRRPWIAPERPPPRRGDATVAPGDLSAGDPEGN